MDSPTWDQYMLPILEVLSERGAKQLQALYTEVAQVTELSDEVKQEVIPSGQQRYKNRIGWAATYLVQAGALERPRRGVYAITQRGRELLGEGVPVTELRLEVYPEFVEFMRKSKQPVSAGVVVSTPVSLPVSPEEVIEAAAKELRVVVEAELLAQVQTMDPLAFERLVLKVLRGMGYGKDGSLDTTKASGDNGIDGIVSQDPLGLDRIYLQAKRYQDGHAVGSPDMREFIGALTMQQGDRGIFITSSTFTKEAREAVRMAKARVELIDGARLVRLMVDNAVGVQPAFTTTIYKIDDDFFEDL
ncbi:MAG: restriction endonuclease [Propionibacteriaceae bacterium]|jgi:restriction system protein|nr:restriction endonuclease [Propionibacteriaceae bacterium]